MSEEPETMPIEPLAPTAPQTVAGQNAEADAQAADYGAESIKVLKGLDAARYVYRRH